MNPSTEDIVNAIKKVGAEKVLILPNNKNIVMAAEQAVELLDIPAAVVATKTIPQGMSAILAFNPEASVEENAEAMTRAFAGVSTAQITTAVRDTSIDGVEIHTDDFMAMVEGKIVASVKTLEEAAEEAVKKVIDEDSEIVTILYGQNTTQQQLAQLTGFIEANYEDVEVEVHNGKQPVYPYIISVE